MSFHRQNREKFQIRNFGTILIKKIKTDILFVIIFVRRKYQFRKNGKINSIKISKDQKVIDQIEHWLCNKLLMRKEYQIKNIIMIH